MKFSTRFAALVAVVLLASGSMKAQQISVDEARATARTILSASASRKAKAMAKEQLSLAYQSVQDGNTHYYVFNFRVRRAVSSSSVVIRRLVRFSDSARRAVSTTTSFLLI